jgi:DNA ligase 1
MTPVLLEELVATSEAVAATRARGAKIDLLAHAIRAADADEVAIAASYLGGDLVQRQIGVGWAMLRELPAPAPTPSLHLRDVDAACATVGARAGAGSRAARRAQLDALFARATTTEQRFLVRLLGGELRHGAQEGLVLEAVARAFAVPSDAVRRARMLGGTVGRVAAAAHAGGAERLAGFRLEVGQPVQPMLAAPGDDVGGALATVGLPAAVEWKVDGARLQAHRDGDQVLLFTRSLDDVTSRLPEVVAAVRALPVRAAVLDGEAVALDASGRPRRFQDTMKRFGAARRGAAMQDETPLVTWWFDALHLDGVDLLDEPATTRWAALAAAVPADQRVPRVVVDDVTAAQHALDAALAGGHEGVVVKSLAAPYAAGRRGAGWCKVKPAHTFDLVVLAAEWGHGRRQGWLSNLHLGARGPDGGFVMLGKTFKGLTDAVLAWQTERLLELEVARDGIVVHVRPELVVEVAIDGLQTSSRYPGGVALRFARVVRYRPDKRAADADELATLLALHRDGSATSEG